MRSPICIASTIASIKICLKKRLLQDIEKEADVEFTPHRNTF